MNRSKFLIFLMMIASQCIYAQAVSDSAIAPPKDWETTLKEFCSPYRQGLPKQSESSNLTGKISTTTKFVTEILSFGNKRSPIDYFIEGPNIPGTNNKTCGIFSFAQVSILEQSTRGDGSFSVTLKNGKTFKSSSYPLSARIPGSKNSYISLNGGVDQDKSSWFWFLAADSRFPDPQEVVMRPENIRKLEIN